ncbi:MAG: nucleotidyltransferase [Deltaproteobacteria bacterium]|nr:nucleotidyltransferase [Deltaproteobacteria bacterium]
MFEKILSRIGASLSKRNLPYMIIGGQAVLLYGEPRLTRDIDITLGVNIDHLDDLLAVVQELSLRPLPKDIESFAKQTMVLPALDETTGIRVDFIFSFTPYETGAIKRARKVRIMDQEVNFASPEDLIIHKIFAGRPRDLEDVRTVLLKNPDIDIQYIRKWLKEFDASSDEKEFLKAFEGVLRGI